MAASDTFHVVVHGKQTHGAVPWGGVDPITVGAQIVTGLQTIVSRQLDLTTAPAVITVGRFDGGVRFNIIPDTVKLDGTIRTLDAQMQKEIHQRLTRTAELIAESAGAEAEVTIEIGNPITVNDPALTAQMLPTLRRIGGSKVYEARPRTVAEDFSKFQQKVPGVFFYLGVNAKDADPKTVAENHSPKFFVDEAALPTGVRAMAAMAIDYLQKR
jgi:amidohydrolase